MENVLLSRIFMEVDMSKNDDGAEAGGSSRDGASDS